jgi:hypothetical protein
MTNQAKRAGSCTNYICKWKVFYEMIATGKSFEKEGKKSYFFCTFDCTVRRSIVKGFPSHFSEKRRMKGFLKEFYANSIRFLGKASPQ